MRKTRIVVLVTICTIIIFGICSYFIHWTTEMDLTFYGALVSRTGNVQREDTISIKATKVNYLFRDDYYTSIEISGFGQTLDSTVLADIYDVSLKFPIEISLRVPFHEKTSFFVPEYFLGIWISNYDQVVLHMGLNQDWCVIDAHNGWDYYVGSTDPDFDAAKVLEKSGKLETPQHSDIPTP